MVGTKQIVFKYNDEGLVDAEHWSIGRTTKGV